MTQIPGPRPWSGGVLSPNVRCVLAANPSPMTLQGTNTYVLRAPGETRSVVVDPGPADEHHLAAVLQVATAEDSRVGAVLLTHTHSDHSGGLERFLQLSGGPPVRGVVHSGLADGDVVQECGLTVRTVATPGHTSDSVSFLLEEERALLTGDTILGWGTTFVAYPDGHLGAYLDSLDRMAELVADGSVTALLPAHGAPHVDAGGIIAAYRDHRHERLDEIRSALAQGIGGQGDLADAIVETVYADAPRALWPAARQSVLAQLEYLRSEFPAVGPALED